LRREHRRAAPKVLSPAVRSTEGSPVSDWIICYDIACPRRLGRIHRCLKRVASPLQYSVFLFSGTEPQLQRCLATLEQLMDPRHDDIRAYPLPQRGLRWCLGRPALPAGIQWSGLPEPWQGSASQSGIRQSLQNRPTQPTMEPAQTSPCIII